MKFFTIDTNYDKYLIHSDLDVVRIQPTKPPATLYNEVIERESGLIAFIHSDVTCCGLHESIQRTIDLYGFLGAMGVVGNGSVWARKGQHITKTTCDPCLVIIDADSPVRFDDKTFDGFHLYVEDYCCQVGGVTLIDIDGYEGSGRLTMDGCDWFIHHSHTLRQKGCAWGDYSRYKQLLNKKWGKIVPTT